MPSCRLSCYLKQPTAPEHLQRCWKLKGFRAKALMHMNSLLKPFSTAAAEPGMPIHWLTLLPPAINSSGDTA